MAWKEKKTVDTSTSIPLPRLARPSEISSYVKKLELKDCIDVPLSEDKLCKYAFHFGPTLDVKKIDAVDEINKIRDSYVVTNNELILSVKSTKTSKTFPVTSQKYL